VIARSMVTQDTQGFLDRSGLLEDNSPMSCVLVLLMVIDVVVVSLGLVPRGVFYPSFCIQGGRG
jgi:hypothetical protein